MDFSDVQSDYSISSFFNVSYTDENRFLADKPFRYHKTPHKKRDATRTSALVIDQLKNGFQRTDDFAPRMRTLRNWRPEFLIRYLRDNRCERDEERTVVRRSKSHPRSFVPETPRIYSIALHSGARNLSDIDDPRSTCAGIKGIENHSSKSAVTPNLLSLKTAEESANQQTTVTHNAESTDIPKFDSFQKIDRCSHCDQPRGERVKEQNANNVPSTSRGDRCLTSDSDDLRVRKDHKHDVPRVTKKDAQIQTSSRKSSRRKRTRGKSKLTNEEVLRRKYDDDGWKFAALCDTSGSRRNEKPSLSVRFLENKRAEYINKFTAVKRQIEEITATLRETCYSDRSSQGNLENCERELSSMHSYARINTKRELANNCEKYIAVSARKEDTAGGKNTSVSIRRITGGSTDDDQNIRQILRIHNVNDETPISPSKTYSKNTTASTVNPDVDLNVNDVVVRDSARMFTVKEMLHPSKSTSRNGKRTKRRFDKEICFNLDLTKRDDEAREFSIENKSFDGIRLLSNPVVPKEERGKILINDFVNFGGSRSCNKIAEDKVGEIAILKDIKERIDRDFDDPLSKCGDDTADFLTVSQENNSFGNDDLIYQPASTVDTTMIEESSNLDSTDMQICNTISASVLSEYSNRNSTLSRYYSCTQFSSYNLTRSEEEDRITIVNGSYADSHPNAELHDLNLTSNVSYSRRVSDLDPNDDLSCLSLNSSFDRSCVNLENITPTDTSMRRASCSKSPPEINEWNNTCEIFREATNSARESEYFLGRSDELEEESRVHLEKRRTTDSTLETSKSSRHIGSIDSGVFLSSSLIELHPRESSFVNQPLLKDQQEAPHTGKPHGSSPTVDFSSDNSHTDDSLDRRINDVIKDLTKNLILCERRVKLRLEEMRKADFQSHRVSLDNDLQDAYYNFFDSSGQSSEDERITDISTPSFVSLSEFEVE